MTRLKEKVISQSIYFNTKASNNTKEDEHLFANSSGAKYKSELSRGFVVLLVH